LFTPKNLLSEDTSGLWRLAQLLGGEGTYWTNEEMEILTRLGQPTL